MGRAGAGMVTATEVPEPAPMTSDEVLLDALMTIMANQHKHRADRLRKEQTKDTEDMLA